MACGFSGIRGFLIAVEPIKIAHRALAHCVPTLTLRSVIRV
jgi:hypothetical protein